MSIKHFLTAACAALLLLATGCVSQSGADGDGIFSLLAGSGRKAASGTQPEAVPSQSAGSDWKRVRVLALAPPRVDKEPEVARLTPLVKKDPRANLPLLVSALVKDAADDFERARALHDWVALNIAYDWAAFTNKAPMIVEPYAVIQHGSSVCAGYSGVFALMCSLAGLECRVINGYGRGYGFDAFAEGALPYASDHAWNAVRISGGWYFVDTTWDAGGADAKGFTFNYSTAYLFTPPDTFLCTHFPQDPQWQLMARPASWEEFKDLPYLRGSFGTLGFGRASPLRRVATVKTGQEITLTVPDDSGLSIYGYLNHLETSKGFQTLCRQEGGVSRMKIVFPAPGRYVLGLSARTDREKSTLYYLGALYFTATEGSRMYLPYLSPEAVDRGLSMEAENGYRFEVDGSVSFSYTYDGESFVSLNDSGGKWISNRVRLTRTGKANTATVFFPGPGQYTIWVNLPDKKSPSTSRGVASLAYHARTGSPLELPSMRDEATINGLSLDARDGYDPRVAGEAQTSFTYEGKAVLSLFDSQGKEVKRHTALSQEGGRYTARVTFPQPGEYTLWILCASPEKPNYYQGTASLHFSASAAGPTLY